MLAEGTTDGTDRRGPGARDQSRQLSRADATPPEPWAPEQWVEVDDEPSVTAARRPRPRGQDSRRAPATTGGVSERARRHLPAETTRELADAVGTARAPQLTERLAQAVRAYDRDRYSDARRILRPLVQQAPRAAAVRELHGLTLYRMGRWKEAIDELEALRALTGSLDQHPVLADCHRALGHHRAVEEVWRELKDASPSAELVMEGRIVAAGSLADQGDIRGAIDLLERGRGRISKASGTRPHQLRLWYVLADLYERAGDLPRARELFGRVLDQDRELFDVAERAASLA